MSDKYKNEFIDTFKNTKTTSNGGRMYWAESAKALGLIDTESDGIRFIGK